MLSSTVPIIRLILVRNNQVPGAFDWDGLGDVMPGCLVAGFDLLRPVGDAERCRRSGGVEGFTC